MLEINPGQDDSHSKCTLWTLPGASQTHCTPTFRMHNGRALSAPLPAPPPPFLHIKNAVALCLEADAVLTADTPQPVSKLTRRVFIVVQCGARKSKMKAKYMLVLGTRGHPPAP